MTTIAYKDGTMACDSCWTAGNAVVAHQTKIKRLASGVLIGEAGDNDSREVRALLNNVRDPDDLPPREHLERMRLDYVSLLVFPDGQLWSVTIEEASDHLTYKAQLYRVTREFFAIGSGSDFATGYMGAGHTAPDAVQFVIDGEYDVNTRGKVYTLRLPSSGRIRRR